MKGGIAISARSHRRRFLIFARRAHLVSQVNELLFFVFASANREMQFPIFLVPLADVGLYASAQKRTQYNDTTK